MSLIMDTWVKNSTTQILSILLVPKFYVCLCHWWWLPFQLLQEKNWNVIIFRFHRILQNTAKFEFTIFLWKIWYLCFCVAFSYLQIFQSYEICYEWKETAKLSNLAKLNTWLKFISLTENLFQSNSSKCGMLKWDISLSHWTLMAVLYYIPWLMAKLDFCTDVFKKPREK